MPNSVYADLHIHTTASDGTFTPADAVNNATNIGLAVMAVTDHDTVKGLEPAFAAACETNVQIVPGIEMGSDINGRDIHILGYYIDYRSTAFLDYLTELNAQRMVRAKEMCARLSAMGMNISVADAMATATGDVLTRAHIARALVNKGLAHSITEVFDNYLGNGKSCFVPKYNLTSSDVITSIKEAGGIPVLAHPKLSRADDAVADLVEQGIEGIEAYCRDHSRADIRHYTEVAAKYGLTVTGGSDCHGPHTPGRFCMGSCGIDRDLFELLSDKRP